MSAEIIGMIASAVGSTTQGFGSIVQGVSQGTESCGSKPFCAFTKSCKERKKAYQDCVNRSLDIQQSAIDQQNQPAEKKGGINTITIVIIAVVVIALILILRKRKKA